MTLTPTKHEASPQSPEPTELLIKEARIRARRRYVRVGLAVLIVVIGSLLTWTLSGERPPVRVPAPMSKSSPGSTLPTGSVVTLNVAGSLAVGPSGVLYVAAPDEHRILARLPNGRFKVVAGTGTSGYSGNGTKAIDAELSNPTDLTFDAAGDLYFADAGRVRVVRTDGIVETVAGGGSSSSPPESRPVTTVADGTPALSASFHSEPSIAFGPDGALYVATDTQLLRMTRKGALVTIGTHRISFGKVPGLPTPLDEGLDTLAVARDGSIYVSGFNGWAIWHVVRSGASNYVGYDRGSGGTFPDLAKGPRGAVYAEDGSDIVRVTPTGLVPVDKLTKVDGQYFWASYFAFGPHGSFYVDELPGNIGFERRQEIVTRRGRTTDVLWTEPRSAAADHSQ